MCKINNVGNQLTVVSPLALSTYSQSRRGCKGYFLADTGDIYHTSASKPV